MTVFYFNTFSNVIYSCDTKLNFQHHYSNLSHDPSEIYYADLLLKKHFSLLSVMFCGKPDMFFSRIF